MKHIFNYLRRHPIVTHVSIMMMIPLVIIFLPIMLYCLIFEGNIPFTIILRHVPWGFLFVVLIIAAVLSLINTIPGIEYKRRHREDKRPRTLNVSDDRKLRSIIQPEIEEMLAGEDRFQEKES